MIFDSIINTENELSNNKTSKINIIPVSNDPTVKELSEVNYSIHLDVQSQKNIKDISFDEHLRALNDINKETEVMDSDKLTLDSGNLFPRSREKSEVLESSLDINLNLNIYNSNYLAGSESTDNNSGLIPVNSSSDSGSGSGSNSGPGSNSTLWILDKAGEKLNLLASNVRQIDTSDVVEQEKLKLQFNSTEPQMIKSSDLPMVKLKENIKLDQNPALSSLNFEEKKLTDNLQLPLKAENASKQLVDLDIEMYSNISNRDNLLKDPSIQKLQLDVLPSQGLTTNKVLENNLTKFNPSIDITSENKLESFISNPNITYLKPIVEQTLSPEQVVLKQSLAANSQFNNGLMVRIQWMLQNSLSSAEIMLDPPELGPLNVKLTQVGNEANIVFQVNTPLGKETLEENISKLKEMLLEQGIKLGDAAIEHNQNGDDTKDDSEDLTNANKDNSENSDSVNKKTTGSEHNLLDTFV